MKKEFRKFFRGVTFFALGICSVLFFSCDSWLTGKNFFDTVADEVKYANATQIPVFVRYADRGMGDTSPNGKSTQKVDIPFTVTATDDNEYGFYRWIAVSTEDMDSGMQYSDFVMGDSWEDFEKQYGDILLPDTEVHFENPKSASTKATVKHERKDVFIIPLCVKRPFVAGTVPESDAKNVVKNASVTIIFSRAMDPDYLINKLGTLNTNYVRIRIRQGGVGNYVYTDVSNTKFGEASLSGNGRNLSIKLAASQTLDPRVMSIWVSRNVQDKLAGYTMAKDFESIFVVGDGEDTVPPEVNELKVGYREMRPTTNNQDSSNVWKQNRVGKTGNIWVNITDKTSVSDIEGTESNVMQVHYQLTRVKRLVTTIPLIGSAELKSDVTDVETAENTYDSGLAMYDPEVTNITDFVGTGFSVNMSSYPDGLYKIRVWGEDLNGQIGNTADSSTYREAYFVKDSTAPSTSNKTYISTSCDEAEYGWYNDSTLGLMQVTGTSDIKDRNSSFTNYTSEKVWWRFLTSDDVTGINGNDAEWKEVSTTPVTLTSMGITLTGDDADPSTGVLPLYVMFRDDMENMSEPAALESLRYDNVAPELSTMKWTDTSGNAIRALTSSSELSTQVLNIPVTETLSGVKIIEVKVNNDTANTPVASPLGNANLKVSYVPEGSSSATVLSSSDYTLNAAKDTIVLNNAVKSGTIKIQYLTVAAATGNVDSSITVTTKDQAFNESNKEKITISCDTVAPVITKAEICDTSDESKLIERTLYEDNTAVSYWLSNDCFAASNDNCATRIPLKLTITETGTGVEKITFDSTGPKPSSSTKVYLSGGTQLVSGTDYKISGTSIIFLNDITPKIKGTDVVVYLTNLAVAEDFRTADGYPIKITVQDFAAAIDDTWSGFTFEGTKKADTKIYAESLRPAIITVSISDTGKDDNGAAEVLDANEGYTNRQTVDLSVTIWAEANAGDELKASGNKALKINSGAEFTNKTEVYVDNTKLAATDYEIDSAEGTITFKKSFIYEHTIKLANVKLSSETNGTKTVSLYTIDTVGWQSLNPKSGSIILDTVAPWMSGADSDKKAGYGPHIGWIHQDKKNIWPRRNGDVRVYGVSASDIPGDLKTTNTDGTGIKYFYTNYKDAKNEYGLDLGLSANDNYSLRNVGTGTSSYVIEGDKTAADVIKDGVNSETDYNGNTIPENHKAAWADEKWFAAPTTSGAKTYSVVITDAAGNYSLSYTFVVVNDAAPKDKIGNGNAASDFVPFVYTDPTNADKGEQWQVLSVPFPTVKGGDKYRNIVAHHDGSTTPGSRAQITADLTGYKNLEISAEGTAIEYYAISGSGTSNPTENSTSLTAWNKWIPITNISADNKITVYPSTAEDVDQAYLWLKDYCGSATAIPILTQDHAVLKATTKPNLTEKWERDGELVTKIGDDLVDLGSISFTGFGNSATTKEGYVSISNSTNYYTEKAYFMAVGSDLHCWLGEEGCDTKAAYDGNTSNPTSDGCFYRDRVSSLDGTNIYTRRAKLILTKTAVLENVTKALVDTEYADDSENYRNGLCSKWDYSGGMPNEARWMRINYPAYYGKNDLGKSDAELAQISKEYPYMYLCMEDGVGYFKVWAMRANGSPWVYDNEAPKVMLRNDNEIYAQGSGATATGNLSTTAVTDANVSKFMPDNAGKHVYVDATGKVRFSGLTDGKVAGSSAVGKNMTYGDLKLAYFDLSIAEANSITGWKYSLSSDIPSSWNTGSVKRDFPIALFDGTPKSESPKDIYLHVKDVVGNVTSAKIGAAKWTPDFNWPGAADDTEKTTGKFKEYSVKYPKGSPYYNSEVLNYTVPSSGKVTMKVSDIGGWFSDKYLRALEESNWIQKGTNSDPNPIYGFSLTQGDFTKASQNLELDFNSASEKKVYLYDQVGNYFTLTVKGTKDSTAPDVVVSANVLKNDVKLNVGGSVSGGKIYCITATVTPSTYSDSGSGIFGWYIDSNPTGSKVEADYKKTPAPYDLPETDGSSLYLHVIDFMGNENDVRLEYYESGLNYTWVCDNTPPEAPTIALDSSSALVATISGANLLYDRSVSTITLKPTSTSTDVKGYNTNGTTQTSSTIAITPSNGQAVTVYAVDYAGNISTASTINLQAADAHAFDFTITGTPTKHLGDSSVNFYNSDIKVTLNWKGFAELKSWKICKDAAGTEVVASSSSATQLVLTLPTTLTEASDLYVYVTSSKESTSLPLKISGESIFKWCYDTTKPTKPTVTPTGMTETKYSFDSKTNTLNFDSRLSQLSFALSSTDANDIFGYNTTGSKINESNTSKITISRPSVRTEYKFYAVDNAGNVSDPITVTCIPGTADSFTPSITGSYKTVDGCNYYNSDVTVSLGWTGFATVKYWQIGTYTSKQTTGIYVSSTSSAQTLVLPATLTSAKTLYVYVEDSLRGTNYVELTGASVSRWCYDATAPSVPVYDSATGAERDGDNIFYKASEASVSITLSSTDDNLWCINSTGTFDATSNVSAGKAVISIANATGEKTFYAVDKAGNKSVAATFNFTKVSPPTVDATITSSITAVDGTKYYGDSTVPTFNVAIGDNGNSSMTYDYGYKIGANSVTCGEGVAAGTYQVTLPTTSEYSSSEVVFWAREVKFSQEQTKSVGNWSYDKIAPTTPELVTVTQDGLVKIDGNTVYHAATVTTIQLKSTDSNLWCINDTGTLAAATNVSTGVATITIPTGTKTYYAVDKAGHKSLTGLELTFVKVAAPTVSSISIQSSTPAIKDATNASGTKLHFFKSGLKFNATVTKAETSGVTYVYGFNTTQAESTSSDLTSTQVEISMPDSLQGSQYWIYVKDSIGQVAYKQINAPSDTNTLWYKYTAPSSTSTFSNSYTCNVGYGCDHTTGSHNNTLTFEFGNCPMVGKLVFTKPDSSEMYDDGSNTFTNLSEAKYGTYTGVINTGSSGAIIDGWTATVNTAFGDTVEYSYSAAGGPSTNRFFGGLNPRVGSVEILSDVPKTRGLTELARYYSVLDTSAIKNNVETVEEESPKSFAIGNKVDVAPVADAKTVVVPVTSGAVSGSIVGSAKQSATDYAWKPENDADLEELAMIKNVAPVENSADLMTSSDYSADDMEDSKSGMPFSVLLLLGLGAVLASLAVFFQKKRQ